MNIGEINGVQVAVSPEAYQEIKKQKIIEENKILKELQQELERYKNIIDKMEYWLLNEAILEFYNNKLPIELVIEKGLNELKELKGSDS